MSSVTKKRQLIGMDHARVRARSRSPIIIKNENHDSGIISKESGNTEWSIEEPMEDVVQEDIITTLQNDGIEIVDGNEKMEIEQSSTNFSPIRAQQAAGGVQFRRIIVPAYRYNAIKEHWMDIYTPIVEQVKLQVRYNPKRKCVELKTSPETVEVGAIQKSTDFIRAFLLGFELKDAIALLRLEDLYVDSFEINEVKQSLHGDNLSRAIGRICGHQGKTKFVIENTTKTRIVVADSKIHLLGSFQNVKLARDMVCRLIMGSPPGKVYNMMRTISSRQKDRF